MDNLYRHGECLEEQAVMVNRTALVFVGCAALGACAEQTAQRAPLPPAVVPRVTRSEPRATKSEAWGIPEFFEVGRNVRVSPDSPPVDTTGWPNAILQAARRGPRAYLSALADEQRQVFVYPEPDPSGHVHRLAMVLPEPRVFSTNGLATAYWGSGAVFLNFGLEGARSFGGFVSTGSDGLRRARAMRARFAPGGVNPQDIENVYELDRSCLAVLEHKGLVPGAPVSFVEFSVYDRDATPDDEEPVPVDPAAEAGVLAVALTPLKELAWQDRRTFESNGYRVVIVTGSHDHSYFLAAPSSLEPRWAFGEAPTDLGPYVGNASDAEEGGAGSAAALLIPHAARGALLSGVVRDASEIPALLERGGRFLTELAAAREELARSNTGAYSVYAARALVASHRSSRDPRSLTEFPYGDAPQPTNSASFSGAIRYGSDAASALRGLSAVQRHSPDPELRRAIAEIAESSLQALTRSGATLSRRFDHMALVAEHDDTDGRSDVFIDNGAAAVAINHRRLVLSSGEPRMPGVTWGALGFTVDGASTSVDEARYAFALDGTTLPAVVRPDQEELAVSRLFTPSSGPLQVRETAELRRRTPVVSVRYRFENRGPRSVALNEARITLGDFLEYGAGANERSQNRYGLSRVVDGVRLPVGFWMEHMPAPLWGDNYGAGEVDLSEAYHRLGSRFLVVYGYEKAQVYFLTRRADQIVLRNVRAQAKGNYDGFTSLEVRYRLDATIEPHASFDLPEVLSYTLRAPLHSTDGDTIPDQLQELAPLWTRGVTGQDLEGTAKDVALETDSNHAGLVYSWIVAAEALDGSGIAAPATSAGSGVSLADKLRQSALKGANFALGAVNQLRNAREFASTYAHGRDYGFHLAVFDWAYRRTCDTRYRDAFITLADDLVRSDRRDGLQISDPKHPSYGGYLKTASARAGGVTSLDDQGVRLWALRIAYERTRAPKYLRSAEALMNRYLRVRPEDHLFTGTVLLDERYRDADIAHGRTPLGQYALLSGLKAWSDVSSRARQLYASGLEHATRRHGVHSVGWTGPYRMIFPREGVFDFGADAELGGWFLSALALDPSSLRGRFPMQCRRSTSAANLNEGFP